MKWFVPSVVMATTLLFAAESLFCALNGNFEMWFLNETSKKAKIKGGVGELVVQPKQSVMIDWINWYDMAKESNYNTPMQRFADIFFPDVDKPELYKKTGIAMQYLSHMRGDKEFKAWGSIGNTPIIQYPEWKGGRIASQENLVSKDGNLELFVRQVSHPLSPCMNVEFIMREINKK